jgi:hypothetical protein
VAGLRGAPRWEPIAVLLTPVLVGGLLWAYPGTLLPYLAYLVAAPATALAAFCGPAIGWRAPATTPSRRPAAAARRAR